MSWSVGKPTSATDADCHGLGLSSQLELPPLEPTNHRVNFASAQLEEVKNDGRQNFHEGLSNCRTVDSEVIEAEEPD